MKVENIPDSVRVHNYDIYEENEENEPYEVFAPIQIDAKKIGRTAKNYLNRKKIGIILSATDFFKALIDDSFIGTGSVRSMKGILMDKTEINNPEEYFENLRNEEDELLYYFNKTHAPPGLMFNSVHNTIEWGYVPINSRYDEYSIYNVYKDAIYDMLYLFHTMCKNIVHTNNIRNYNSHIEFKRTYDLLKKSQLFKNNDKLMNVIYLMKVIMSILKRIEDEAYYKHDDSELTISEFLDQLTIRFLIPNMGGKERNKKKTCKKRVIKKERKEFQDKG